MVKYWQGFSEEYVQDAGCKGQSRRLLTIIFKGITDWFGSFCNIKIDKCLWRYCMNDIVKITDDIFIFLTN